MERDEQERPLTPREREVLALVADGLGNKAIGRRLGVRPDTVRGTKRRIHRVLDAHTAPQAVAVAIRRGLIP